MVVEHHKKKREMRRRDRDDECEHECVSGLAMKRVHETANVSRRCLKSRRSSEGEESRSVEHPWRGEPDDRTGMEKRVEAS